MKGGKATCHNLKERQVLYCLGETCKCLSQYKVRKSSRIGLIRDESKNRLHFRAKLVTNKLQVQHVFISTQVDPPKGSKELAKATADAIRKQVDGTVPSSGLRPPGAETTPRAQREISSTSRERR